MSHALKVFANWSALLSAFMMLAFFISYQVLGVLIVPTGALLTFLLLVTAGTLFINYNDHRHSLMLNHLDREMTALYRLVATLATAAGILLGFLHWTLVLPLAAATLFVCENNPFSKDHAKIHVAWYLLPFFVLPSVVALIFSGVVHNADAAWKSFAWIFASWLFLRVVVFMSGRNRNESRASFGRETVSRHF